eukprot:scaffold5111_cov84-Skeletonema_dohrnii-CCMP3373.AAC.3
MAQRAASGWQELKIRISKIWITDRNWIDSNLLLRSARMIAPCRVIGTAQSSRVSRPSVAKAQ